MRRPQSPLFLREPQLALLRVKAVTAVTALQMSVESQLIRPMLPHHMHPRAEQLIDSLGLLPHPEGGWYRQVFKSDEYVQRTSDGAARSALTTIYFLLVEGTFSAWHRVDSDEVWHFYEGEPLELLSRASEDEGPLVRVLDEVNRVEVVRARHWQAARPLGAYTLVGCTVGPGFEFADFELKPGPI